MSTTSKTQTITTREADFLALGHAIVADNCDNAAKNAGRYPMMAYQLGLLFANEPDRVHPALVELQDSATNADGWNLTMTNLRKQVQKLSDPLKFVATRAYNESHRNSNPLFELARVADLKIAEAEAEAERKAKAERLEQAEAQRKAEAEALADADTTATDIAEAAYAEADRLGISIADVVNYLISAHCNALHRAEIRLVLNVDEAEAEAEATIENAS